METDNGQNDAFQELLALNERLFNQQQYEAAYHTLAAAFHLAIDSNTPELLRQIENIAKGQSAWIDQYHPEHPLSTNTKSSRPYKVFIYRGLAVMARARTKMAEHNRGNSRKQ